MRLAGLVSLLPLLTLACNPSGGGSTDATGSSGAGGSTSAPTTTGSTTAATESPTTGASASTSTSGATSSSTTAASTSSASTTTTTTATTAVSATEPGTGGQTSTGDTGGPATCAAANGDYGDCDAVLGVAFDGTECTARSGCSCAPDCDKFFPDMVSCALACADAGHCNEDRIKAAGIAKDPIAPGGLCDEIDVCPGATGLEGVFQQIFGMLTCEPMGYPCQSGKTCHGLWQNMLGPEEWRKTCAASLVQGSGDIFCVIWGP